MCVSEVVKRFTLISQLSAEEVSDWIFLCHRACEYIEQRRLPTCAPSAQNEERLLNAAAVYAFYLYSRYACDGTKSFTAGDIKVEADKSLQERAYEMWGAELKELRGLLLCDGDPDFCFFRV